jgi:hypothetical protein
VGRDAATTIAFRVGDAGNDSTLRGNISAYDPIAKRLVVRDVNVDVSNVSLAGRPAAGLSNGLFVAVTGRLSRHDGLSRAKAPRLRRSVAGCQQQAADQNGCSEGSFE